MTMPTDKSPAGNADEGRPQPESAQPSGRRPALSGREIASVLSLVLVIAAAALYAFRDADNPIAGKKPVRGPEGRDNLTIDGNRNGRAVAYSHLRHLAYVAPGREGCAQCHHLSRPSRGSSSCADCHGDMDRKSVFFNHDGHISLMKDSGSCSACHRGDRSRKNTARCGDCHDEYGKDNVDYRSAPAYRDALHELCYRCHNQGEKPISGRKDCAPCHRDGNIPRR